MSRARRSRGRTTRRDYPRTARLGELFREILADELRAIDEEWTAHVVITGVDVDPDLRRARVWFDTAAGADGDEDAAAQLEEVRHRLQRALATEARARRTPELVFAPDPGVRQGEHIDDVLRELRGSASGIGADGGDPGDAAAGDG